VVTHKEGTPCNILSSINSIFERLEARVVMLAGGNPYGAVDTYRYLCMGIKGAGHLVSAFFCTT